jgi:ribose transport system ATP-binding protein
MGPAMPNASPALELVGITKSFPGVMALRNVSLRVTPGTIHALLGENGAGKSTLIKIVTGVHAPDAGTMRVDGVPVRFSSPMDAIAAGIGVVHQERNLIPRFSVGENILLERIAQGTLRPIDYTALNREALQWLQMLELKLDPALPVTHLSVAMMQMVEIARALSLRSHVLLMDEPTASLTPHETEALFRILRRLRDQGVAIVFVSHKLEEVLDLCDTVTVLRDGGNACESRPLAGMTRADLVQLMIGRAEQIPDFRAVRSVHGVPALELRNAATEHGHRDINLAVRHGEVVGLYGLVGAGRSELARSIIGLDRITGGQVLVEGRPVRIRSVAEALNRHGIGYVSEDRKQEGVILLHSVLANAGITIWPRLLRWVRFLHDGTIAAKVGPVLRQLEVKAPSLEQPVANLSGGNQQKVSVAKWLVAGTDIMIIDEPTVGIDVRAKTYFHELIRGLAERGAAILLISSDMPELIAVADRIVVMHEYQIVGDIGNDRNYGHMSQAIMSEIHGTESSTPVA